MEISVSIENGLKNIYIYVIMLAHNELFGCACAAPFNIIYATYILLFSYTRHPLFIFNEVILCSP